MPTLTLADVVSNHRSRRWLELLVADNQFAFNNIISRDYNYDVPALGEYLLDQVDATLPAPPEQQVALENADVAPSTRVAGHDYIFDAVNCTITPATIPATQVTTGRLDLDTLFSTAIPTAGVTPSNVDAIAQSTITASVPSNPRYWVMDHENFVTHNIGPLDPISPTTTIAEPLDPPPGVRREPSIAPELQGQPARSDGVYREVNGVLTFEPNVQSNQPAIRDEPML